MSKHTSAPPTGDPLRIREGLPFPLGATWDGLGVNFALFSANATKVELCLFDNAGQSEQQRIALPCGTDGVWHGLLPSGKAGLVYGYRVHGELIGACHVGSNLVPVGELPEALDAFVQAIGTRRHVASIVGPAAAVTRLHAGLCERWGSSWTRPREIRSHQPLMVIRVPPLVEPDRRIQRVDTSHFDAYVKAAVAMYTEEVGVSPLASTSLVA